jgi:hypothetical protein
MHWMGRLGVVTAILIEGVLPHFNLLVTGHRLMWDVIKPVTRALPEPVEKQALSL